MLKTEGKIPYSLSLIRKILMDTPGMDKWDKAFSKHEVIETFPEENGIIKSINYLYIKFPLMMSNRDIVQEKKIVEHKSKPPQKKEIRAEMILTGIYLREDKKDECLIYMINNVDLKIKTGIDLVNKIAKKSPKEFIENLTKFCKKSSK